MIEESNLPQETTKSYVIGENQGRVIGLASNLQPHLVNVSRALHSRGNTTEFPLNTLLDVDTESISDLGVKNRVVCSGIDD